MKPQTRLSDEDYDFVFSRAPRLCVDVVIKDKRGVLLTWRVIEPEKNKWHLPGGRVLFGESLQQAAQRIIKKELGIKVKIVRPLGFMEFLKEKQNGKIRHSVSTVFLAQPLQASFKTDFQSSKADFFKAKPAKGHKVQMGFLQKNKLF